MNETGVCGSVGSGATFLLVDVVWQMREERIYPRILIYNSLNFDLSLHIFLKGNLLMREGKSKTKSTADTICKSMTDFIGSHKDKKSLGAKMMKFLFLIWVHSHWDARRWYERCRTPNS